MLRLKRTSTESLQIELVTKYDTNDAHEGVQICEGRYISASEYGRGSPNPRGSKSAVTPAQNVRDFW